MTNQITVFVTIIAAATRPGGGGDGFFSFMHYKYALLNVYNKYRLYTEVQVSTLFTQPRAEGPRLCKSRRDRTEVYNGLVPWATWP